MREFVKKFYGVTFENDLNNYVEINNFTKFLNKLCKGLKKEPELSQLMIQEKRDPNAVFINDKFDKYDAIYVDEVQDFSPYWLKFLYDKLVKGNPEERKFYMAGDDFQSIYRHKGFIAEQGHTWRGLGIPLIGRGRSIILKRVYRNSPEIWLFCYFYLNISQYSEEEKSKIEFLSKNNDLPEIQKCTDLNNEISFCIKKIKNNIKSGFSYRDIMIIYKKKQHDNIEIIEGLVKNLQKENIPCEWITESQKSKGVFNWKENSIKISTVASSKGMDSDSVIMLHVDLYASNEESKEEDLKLIYVGMTRARRNLTLIHSKDNYFTDRLYQSKNNLKSEKNQKLLDGIKRASDRKIFV